MIRHHNPMPEPDLSQFDQYRFKTAFGYSALAYCSNPFRLVRVFLPRPTKRALDEKLQGLRRPKDRHPNRIRIVARTIESYFQGEQLSIPWDDFDFSAYTANQVRIYRQVAKIPYGHVRSYSDIAGLSGMPNASRFVGNCMARNPYPVFIPCHRVVREDGTLGGFGGGLDLKQRMLDMESRNR